MVIEAGKVNEQTAEVTL